MKRPLQPRPSEAEPAERHAPSTDLLRQRDVCARLGISDETWRRWRARGRTPAPVALPGRPRWRREDIDRLVDTPGEDARRRHAFRRGGLRLATGV